MFDRHLKSGRLRLEDQKHAAWAFVVGERPRNTADGFRRRPHPGMLPDVDFDRAIPDPGHRPLLSRIADFLWGDPRRSAVAAGRRGGAQGGTHGRSRRTPRRGLYWRGRGRRRGDSRVDRGLAKAGRRFDTDRYRARRLDVARAFTSIECHDNVPLV